MQEVFAKCGAMQNLSQSSTMTNRTIAIILARGGSKGIKKKKLIRLKNKPLIYWSIKACLKTKKISSVWVSSDSDEILKISKKFGAKIIKRPKKFALDNSSSEQAWLHAIKFLKVKRVNPKNIVGIQPTSPIRSSKVLNKAIIKFEKKKLDSLFSAMKISNFFVWKKSKKSLKPNYDYRNRPMRQNIKEKFLENGSFYIFKSEKFLKEKCRLFGKIGYFAMNKIESLEIDDFEDLKIVKSLKVFLKD